MSQDAIDRLLEKGREESQARARTWAERWSLKSNREKAEYLVNLTDVTGRLTEYDGRVLQAAQVYATLALSDQPTD